MAQENKYIIPSQLFSGENSEKLSEEMVHHAVPNRDERTYLISFSNYRKKSCELNDLESGSPKKIVRWIKEIGLSSLPDELNGFQIKPVRNENHYGELFSSLPLDVEMKEIILPGSNRLFYYIDEANKVVNCILMKSSHFETKKNKK